MENPVNEIIVFILRWRLGDRCNEKMPPYQLPSERWYTLSRTSYFYDGKPYTWKVFTDTYSPKSNEGTTLEWRHNWRNSFSNHQPHDCLFNRLFRRRSKETSKLRVTGLCAGNSPGTGEFPAQMASNAENVSIWWRHHENRGILLTYSALIHRSMQCDTFISLSIVP